MTTYKLQVQDDDAHPERWRDVLNEHGKLIVFDKEPDARAKLDAGASLVQIYSGLVYRGPQLISDIRRAFAARPAAQPSGA